MPLLTREVEDSILELLETRLPKTEIGRQVGVSVDAVLRVERELGPQAAGRQQKAQTPDDLAAELGLVGRMRVLAPTIHHALTAGSIREQVDTMRTILAEVQDSERTDAAREMRAATEQAAYQYHRIMGKLQVLGVHDTPGAYPVPPVTRSNDPSNRGPEDQMPRGLEAVSGDATDSHETADGEGAGSIDIPRAEVRGDPLRIRGDSANSPRGPQEPQAPPRRSYAERAPSTHTRVPVGDMEKRAAMPAPTTRKLGPTDERTGGPSGDPTPSDPLSGYRDLDEALGMAGDTPAPPGAPDG